MSFKIFFESSSVFSEKKINELKRETRTVNIILHLIIKLLVENSVSEST